MAVTARLLVIKGAPVDGAMARVNGLLALPTELFAVTVPEKIPDAVGTPIKLPELVNPKFPELLIPLIPDGNPVNVNAMGVAPVAEAPVASGCP